MALALIVAVLSVGAGVLLALVRRGGVLLPPIRTFALVAALAVVLGQLLPAALEELGLLALALLGVSFAAPALVEKLEPIIRPGHTYGEREGHSIVGLEVGYLGLLLHQVGDGVGMGVFSSAHHEGHDHTDVILALAAHTVPLTAVVVSAFVAERGARTGLLRAAGLAAAVAAGVVAAALVETSFIETAEPWIAAIVGGLLLHVIAHDWHPEHSPGHHEPAPGRGPFSLQRGVWELVALGAGLAILFVGAGHHHADGETNVRAATAVALLDLTLETAPTLLFGLLIGAALQILGSRIPMRWLGSGSTLRQAVRGAIVGAPLPICACGVLPIADSLRMRGGTPALVVAFLLATPELGVETFALTVRFLGWEMAIVRVVAAVALAILVALAVARVADTRAATSSATASIVPVAPPDDPDAGVLRRTLGHFEELLHHVGPWTLVGLVIAAYVQAALPEDALAGWSALGLDILVVTLVALPSYVCAASATPLAAILIMKGMSPGAALAGLLLGPATNVATVGFLRQRFGGKATFVGLASLVAATWVVAFALNLSPLHATVPVELTAEAHRHGWVAWGATAALAAFVLRAVFRGGLRAWLATLGESLGLSTAEAGHGHGHGHGHGR